MRYITAAATTNLGQVYGIRIQVNASLTGTITVSDDNGVQAIITNPAGGQAPTYYGFVGNVIVTTSAICDITVSYLNKQG